MKFLMAALLGVASTQAFLVARPSPVVSPPSSLSKRGATTLHDSDAFLPRPPPPFRAPQSTQHPGQDVDTLQGRLFATDTRRVILFDGGTFFGVVYVLVCPQAFCPANILFLLWCEVFGDLCMSLFFPFVCRASRCINQSPFYSPLLLFHPQTQTAVSART